MGRNFWGRISPNILTVDSKPSNIWQNLVSMGSARHDEKRLNYQRVSHNKQRDLIRFWVKCHEKQVNFQGTRCRQTIAFWFVDATFRSGDMRCRMQTSRIKQSKFSCFGASNFRGTAPKFFGAFANRHHFRPTGQVWLRSHGWSFSIADEIKKNKLQW